MHSQFAWVSTGILLNFTSIVLSREPDAKKHTTTHGAGGNHLLTQVPKMKMSQLQKSDNVEPVISETFLKHLEETTELLENTHAKTLLKKAIKQIRDSKDMDAE